MQDKMRYILRLLIVVMLNVFLIALLGHVYKASTEPKVIGTLAKIGDGTIEAGYTQGLDSTYRLLAELISAEAGDSSYLAQVAVGAVVLNRVAHPSFADTIAEVAYQPNAFPGLDSRAGVTESALRAAREALNGVDPTGGALYYYSSKNMSVQETASRQIHLTIGELIFCS